MVNKHFTIMVPTFFVSFSPNHAGICTLSIFMDRSSSINCLYLSCVYWSAVDCICSYCSCFIASACTNSSCEIIYKTKVRVMICIIHVIINEYLRLVHNSFLKAIPLHNTHYLLVYIEIRKAARQLPIYTHSNNYLVYKFIYELRS